jgi:hypothetical protein
MKQLEKLLEAYKASGRCAFYYPRKQMVSLNGHKAIPVKDAMARMTETMARDNATFARLDPTNHPD